MKPPGYLNRLFRILMISAFLISACNFFYHLPKSLDTAISTIQPDKTEIPSDQATKEAAEQTPTSSSPVKSSQGPRFALYSEPPGEVTPLISQEIIAPDLANVRNPFVLSKGQIDRLGQIGFVVSPGNEKEFYILYEKSRYDNVPIFVTSDSMLHSYHLLFDKVLRSAETNYFIPMLRQLNQAMLAETDKQYQSFKGTAWEDAARRTVAYFAVGSKLLDQNIEIPTYVTDLAEPELNLIAQASAILPSPIFPGLEFGEDYTQYIPRGHYTKSEELKAYFKSMMWYGRMNFRLHSSNPEVGKAETRAALLLVNALRNAQVDGKQALNLWENLYAPTVFFVGRSDDLTAVQYGDVMNYVYGENPDLSLLLDETKLGEFIELADQLPPPKILGMVISDSADEEKTTKGLRFMGQRFVPDAYIFRQLVYRNVSTADNRRGLPKGLDLMAGMGSERAYKLLEASGDTAYEKYPEQMEKVRTWLKDLTVPEWTETLYTTWLYTFFPLLDVPGEGFPDFMRSQPWLDKQLNTALGSWAELKHDTILYAKQVYAEMGGGPPPPPPLPPRNYVEPVPQFFARLAALTAMTRTGLENRGLLSDADRDGLAKIEDLSRSFQVMAEKELRGEPLTEDENEKIRYYGGELENLVILSADMDTQEQGIGTPSGMAENQQAAVIADVATDPDPTGSGSGGPVVLEEGVGRINEIYVVAPTIDNDGRVLLQVQKGGVFSYYEFPWPAVDRLTDEKWQQMLDEGKAPMLPPLTNSFYVAETGNDGIREGISQFQDNLTSIYWDPVNYIDYLNANQEPWRLELQELNAQKRYMGHQLVSSQVRSYDLQSPTLAVVTVRETWQDKLYSYTGDLPLYDESPISEREPYSLDVTYSLEQVEQDGYISWVVKQTVYNTPRPTW